MSMTKQRIRLDYLDIAKCITIFLVIVGHVSSNTDDPFYRCAIYYFHMPLFFIVSGVVIRKHQTTKYDLAHYKDLILKNVFMLLIPYYIWALIYSNFSYAGVLQILYGSWQSLAKAGTLTSLWYLPCLFLARIWMELVLNSSNLFPKINRHVYAFVCSIVAFVIGFSLPALENGYPMCLDISFVALGYMLIGYSYKEYLNKLEEKSNIYHFIMLFVYICLFIFGVTYEEKTFLVLMCGSIYGNIPLLLLNSLSGCGIVITLSVIISKYWKVNQDSKAKDTILWIGRNTIGIYFIHKPFMQQVIVPIFTNMGYSTDSFVIALICATITLPISCAAVYGINKYFPNLFHKQQQKIS